MLRFLSSLKHKNQSVNSSIRSCILSGLLAFSLVATLYVSLIPFSPTSLGNIPLGSAENSTTCSGRRVFIYNLPPEFNVDIVNSWCNVNASSNLTWMCDYHLQNNGLGLPARVSDEGIPDVRQFPSQASRLLSSCRLLPSSSWFRTGQFSLELILHHRFRSYDCLTTSPQAADVYYLPYYVGTDIRRNLFNTHVQLRDKLVQRMIGYLEAIPWWRNANPRRHVMVLGRIAWDFKRREETDGYGSSLLELPETKNMTKLLIERAPWEESEMAVPYPTGFHPRHESEVGEWIAHVLAAERPFRVSFAGSPPRSRETDSGALRRVLRENCEAHEECEVLRCEKVDCQANPEVVNCLALASVFCLVPPGDSLTRKGLFDSLLSGCVPVLFDRHTAGTQYLWHLPVNVSEYSIYFPKAGVMDGSVDVIGELARFSAEQVSLIQRKIVEIIPRIVYADAKFGGGEDAFDVIVKKLGQL